MDALHFRRRAAYAREIAKSGEDPWISEMLLEVAGDLDAEAATIDAECAVERGRFSPEQGPRLASLLVWTTDTGSAVQPVRVVNISRGGATLRTDLACRTGVDVILDLRAGGLRLSGRIVCATDHEAGMVFQPASTHDPAFACYLRSLNCVDATSQAVVVG